MALDRFDGLDGPDAALDRDLKGLQRPRAPHALLPRVMAAVAQPVRRPWYACRWTTWPVGWQMLSSSALLALVGAVLIFIPRAYDVVAHATSRLAWHAPAGLRAFAANVESAASFMRIAWRVWLQPLIVLGFIFVIVVSLGCFACWPTVRRLALGGASQS